MCARIYCCLYWPSFCKMKIWINATCIMWDSDEHFKKNQLTFELTETHFMWVFDFYGRHNFLSTCGIASHYLKNNNTFFKTTYCFLKKRQKKNNEIASLGSGDWRRACCRLVLSKDCYAAFWCKNTFAFACLLYTYKRHCPQCTCNLCFNFS